MEKDITASYIEKDITASYIEKDITVFIHRKSFQCLGNTGLVFLQFLYRTKHISALTGLCPGILSRFRTYKSSHKYLLLSDRHLRIHFRRNYAITLCTLTFDLG